MVNCCPLYVSVWMLHLQQQQQQHLPERLLDDAEYAEKGQYYDQNSGEEN